MLGPFATTSRLTPIQQMSLPVLCAPPAHRCPRRQRQRVTEGTAMAPWNGPNDDEHPCRHHIHELRVDAGSVTGAPEADRSGPVGGRRSPLPAPYISSPSCSDRERPAGRRRRRHRTPNPFHSITADRPASSAGRITTSCCN